MKLGEIAPEYHAAMSSRGRAALVYDFIKRDALARFMGREAERIRTMDDYNSLLVYFGDDVILRFKYFDDEKRPRNYPTLRQLLYRSQELELPGMPPEATKLSIGYRLNETATAIRDIYITCWRDVSLVWSYPLYEAVPSDILFAGPEILEPTVDAERPKTIVRAKANRKKAEGS